MKPTAVDLYCGCGAVTEGLKRSGFRVVSAVDFHPIACASYRANHPEVSLYEMDIAKLDPRGVRSMDLGGSDTDLLAVCAPCQPFSNQNRKQADDERAFLILQAIRFAEVLKPKLIFFENVPGLASLRNASILSKLRSGLHELNYHIGDPIHIDAADYGVPQRRARCIMLASKSTETPRIPPPTTPPGSRRTVRDVIGNLPPIESGGADPMDKMHFARMHRPLALQRMSHIPKDGGDRFSLPSELELRCHKGHKGHPDVYGRMRWDDVSPTLTTGCTDITRGRFMHPRDNRAISLREAARLQTFSDTYQFKGSPKAIAEQIGNAVPVQLVESIALSLYPAAQNSMMVETD